MSRGMSFEPTKQERDAEDRRRRVKKVAMELLTTQHSISAADVFAALDHQTPPTISPANSGNILALLAREGALVVVVGHKREGQTSIERAEGVSMYTLPPRRFAVLPVKTMCDGDIVKPLTREQLMAGRARPARPRYKSLMEVSEECVEQFTKEITTPTQNQTQAEVGRCLPNVTTSTPILFAQEKQKPTPVTVSMLTNDQCDDLTKDLASELFPKFKHDQPFTHPDVKP